MAQDLKVSEAQVLQTLQSLLDRGAISRVGGVFAPGGGAALLAAMAVPAERLESVAALVSACPGVNHNYQRERSLQPLVRDDRCGRGSGGSRHAASGIGNRLARAAPAHVQRAYRIDLVDLRHADRACAHA